MDKITDKLWGLKDLELNGLLTDADILERNDLEKQLEGLKSMKLHHVRPAAGSE